MKTPVTVPSAATVHVGATVNSMFAGIPLEVTKLQAPAAAPTKPEPKIAMDTPLTPEGGLRTIRGLRTKLTGPTTLAPGLAVTEMR